LLVILQEFVNSQLDKASNTCGCACIDTRGDGRGEKVRGFEYSDLDQAGTCSIPTPPEWPPLLQMPAPEYRVVVRIANQLLHREERFCLGCSKTTTFF
jgi:hypothetical protein